MAIIENKLFCHLAFSGAFAFCLFLGLAEQAAPGIWPLAYLLLEAVIFAVYNGDMEISFGCMMNDAINTDRGCGFRKLVEGFVFQFLGAIIGGVVSCNLLKSTTGPSIQNIDNWWMALIYLSLVSAFTFLIYSKIPTENTLERNLYRAITSIAGVFVIQFVMPGAVGGITLDLGRFFASFAYEQANHNNPRDIQFEDLLVWLLAPIIGVFLTKFLLWLEQTLGAMDAAENATDKDAEQAPKEVEADPEA